MMKKSILILLSFPFLLSGCFGNVVNSDPTVPSTEVSIPTQLASIEIIKSKIAINVNDSNDSTADYDILDNIRFLPSNAEDKTILVHTSNANVVDIISGTGLKARNEGDAVITVKSDKHPEISATFTVSSRQMESSQVILTVDEYAKYNFDEIGPLAQNDQLYIVNQKGHRDTSSNQTSNKTKFQVFGYDSTNIGYGVSTSVVNNSIQTKPNSQIVSLNVDVGSVPTEYYIYYIESGVKKYIAPNTATTALAGSLITQDKSLAHPLTLEEATDINGVKMYYFRYSHNNKNYYFGCNSSSGTNKYGFFQYSDGVSTKDIYNQIYAFDIFVNRKAG